jgi:hypothetical protein
MAAAEGLDEMAMDMAGRGLDKQHAVFLCQPYRLVPQLLKPNVQAS